MITDDHIATNDDGTTWWVLTVHSEHWHDHEQITESKPFTLGGRLMSCVGVLPILEWDSVDDWNASFIAQSSAGEFWLFPELDDDPSPLNLPSAATPGMWAVRARPT